MNCYRIAYQGIKDIYPNYHTFPWCQSYLPPKKNPSKLPLLNLLTLFYGFAGQLESYGPWMDASEL